MSHPIPSPELLAWSDCELGVLIHLDVQVFEPTYRFRETRDYQPSPSVFDPRALDTDQWVKAAYDAGAKYAVLTAKHCSGFCLWPSKDYAYSIAHSPYKNGQGDIVGEFIASCKKYGLHPGLYYSLAANAFYFFDQPAIMPSVDSEAMRAYNTLVEQQLTELWNNYGDLFEIWFDGGIYDGAPDVPALLQQYQPHAICFQGPGMHQNTLRWVGNERGIAPYPTWSTAHSPGGSGGVVEDEVSGRGDPNASYWIPAETDTPLRFEEWFWYAGDEDKVKSVDELVDVYCQSVGHNTNLLLGLVIDDNGLVPDRDRQVLEEFGVEIKRCFGNPIAVTQGAGSEVTLDLGQQPISVNQLVLMEDIAHGERVREYVVEGYCQGQWQVVATGSCIGHKRIERFDPVEMSQVRLICSQSIAEPKIRQLAAFSV